MRKMSEHAYTKDTRRPLLIRKRYWVTPFWIPNCVWKVRINLMGYDRTVQAHKIYDSADGKSEKCTNLSEKATDLNSGYEDTNQIYHFQSGYNCLFFESRKEAIKFLSSGIKGKYVRKYINGVGGS